MLEMIAWTFIGLVGGIGLLVIVLIISVALFGRSF